jgi:hypothetical protein
MKTLTIFLSIIIFSVWFSSCTSKVSREPVPPTDISEFIGQWTLDIEGGTVGWLEVRQEEGYLDADLLWIAGSVLPVSDIFFADDRYLLVTNNNPVIRKRDADGKPVRTQVITDWLEITKDGDKISGMQFSPHRNGIGGDSVSFTGTKLPPVPPAPDLSRLKFGDPVQLFNGKDLTGWKLTDESLKNGFSVIDGVLENNPAQVEGQPHITYGNLRTEQVFKDFNLKLEVNVPTGSNSGVYLKGMYEIQVLDSYKHSLDSHNMGAVYSRITPAISAEKPSGEWQSLDITLCERHITVILNGTTIIDNQPVDGPTGGAIISDVFSPGPILLQGDHGKVSYRNINSDH